MPPMAAPTLDGRTTGDTEWRGAASLTGWADAILGVANGDGTVVAVGHDAANLYVRFTCPIPEKFRLNKVVYASFPLKMTIKERDGDVDQDDHVGVTLSPAGRTNMYRIAVNGLGTVRDSCDDDVAWNGQWKIEQSRDDFAWTVEMAIPLSQFGAGIAEDQAWGVNFTHGARHIELLDSVWAYQPATQHPLSEMVLSTKPIAVSLDSWGQLSEGVLALRAQVANFTPQAQAGTMDVTVRDLAGDTKPVFGPEQTGWSVQPGGQQELTARMDAGGPLCGKVAVVVRDARGQSLLEHDLPFVFSREMSVETRFIPTPSLLQLVMDLGSPAALKKVAGGTVRVVSVEDAKEVLAQPLPALTRAFSTTDIDAASLPPGHYEVAVELSMGATKATLKDRFVKEPPPRWLGNTIGITDSVPVPWTPLKTAQAKAQPGDSARQAAELTVSCWGRDYTFGAAGFPKQINVQGQDILAGPVRIFADTGHGPMPLRTGSCRVTEETGSRVTFKSIGEAGGLRILAETWIEFDGFVWNTFQIRSDSSTPPQISGLSIEIPLKKQFATLWWHPALARGMLNGRMGAPPDKPWAGEPLNFLRLGDEEHGIQFCYESVGNWRAKPGQGQELIPGEDEYVLRYNLIGQPTRPDKPLEFSLGYMALPCRPRSEVFRRINANNQWSGGRVWPDMATMEKHRWIFQTYIFESGWQGRRDSNYFNLWNREVFDADLPARLRKEAFASWDANHFVRTLYYQGSVNDANTPEYRAYRFEWKGTPGNAPYIAPDPKTREKPVMASVCQQSRSYVDFQLWNMDKAVRELSDNGKIPMCGYQDCGGHPLCMNTLHGCPAEGHFPVLANRQWAKRVYVMFKAINPLNQLYIHTGGESAMNWCGFFDVIVEGEQFTAEYLGAQVNDPSLPNDYTRLFSLDRFRVQCQPYAWGPDRFFLTQFHEWMHQQPDEARGCMGHLWGLSMVHDVPVWASLPPANVIRGIAELGWDDQVTFIPYWRKRTGIEMQTSEKLLVASGWRRGEGNLLVLVLNDGDEPAKGELRVDFARFGFKPGDVQCRDYGPAGLAYPDAMFTASMKKDRENADLQQLPVIDTTISSDAGVPVEIGRHSFKMLRFHP
ncbi:MAG: hypothetical protein IT440_05585 [Phycisphaeraceae bacterium]|nr:hypothetical protein [Phycisphaeraceae bacterium]